MRVLLLPSVLGRSSPQNDQKNCLSPLPPSPKSKHTPGSSPPHCNGPRRMEPSTSGALPKSQQEELSKRLPMGTASDVLLAGVAAAAVQIPRHLAPLPAGTWEQGWPASSRPQRPLGCPPGTRASTRATMLAPPEAAGSFCNNPGCKGGSQCGNRSTALGWGSR